MSDWDQFEEQEPAPLPTRPSDESLGAKIEAAAVALAAAEATYKSLCEEAIAQVPEDFGDHVLVSGARHIIVSRPTRYEWDEKILDSLFGAGKTPEFVKRKFSVDKRRFDRLTEEDRAPLLPALTRKPGPVTVKVTLKDD